MTQLEPRYLCHYEKGNPFVKCLKYFDVQYHNKRKAVNADSVVQPLGTAGGRLSSTPDMDVGIDRQQGDFSFQFASLMFCSVVLLAH